MAIRLYNTLTRTKEVLEPLVPGKIGMYTCGPTVYSFAHIGNLRTFMFQDLLRRHLIYRGYEVRHVMNITDVEDKIIRTCRETGESLKSMTNRYADAFLEDCATLGILPPGELPRATDHIPEMVALIKRLEANGHTYEQDGSIYYRIKSFPGYGKLSHFDIDTLEAGASGRVDRDEYSTEDARDFALWKAYVPEDGAVFWETDLGKGRPGWHLECSCMSMKYLGESFDIHCGAVDLVFPHHENEIAQSEGATGKPFVRVWLHAAHLNLEGRKISKSLGNTVTLRDLLNEGHDPLAIRYALRSTHYRQPTNFSAETLEQGRQSIHRIQDFRRRLKEVQTSRGDDLAEASAQCEEAFAEALDDDLNISAALAVVFEFIRDTNRLLDGGALSQAGTGAALAMLDRLDTVCGLFGDAPSDETPEEIVELVHQRQAARRSKDFAKADAVRDTLAGLGWVVEDTPDGPRVKPA
jgi:cysteinyl-tRNA synthetase